MGYIFSAVVFLFIVFGFFGQCSDPKPTVQYNVEVKKFTAASDGLDLKAVGTLLEKSDNASEFEKLLNSKTEGVNNLDLNQDNKVDYISVTEYGNSTVKGFSLTTEVSPGEEQEVATIEVEKQAGNQANVNIHGNQQIYGNSHHNYHYSGVGTFLLMSYLFTPHSFYASPYGWGRYPGYYGGGWRTSSYNDYSNRSRNYRNNSKGSYKPGKTKTTKIRSPNASKSSTKIKAGLKNPSKSQKSFQTRQASKVRSGGFGKKAKVTSPSKRSSGFGSVRSSNRSGGSSWGK